MSRAENASLLELISGKRLDAVCFVLDYATFQFGDLVLAALASPLVIEGGVTTLAKLPGYRDALCRQIERTVVSTSEGPQKLELVFGGGSKIVIPLDAPDPPGPEMASLSERGQFVTAWLRPGTQSKPRPNLG